MLPYLVQNSTFQSFCFVLGYKESWFETQRECKIMLKYTLSNTSGLKYSSTSFLKSHGSRLLRRINCMQILFSKCWPTCRGGKCEASMLQIYLPCCHSHPAHETKVHWYLYIIFGLRFVSDILKPIFCKFCYVWIMHAVLSWNFPTSEKIFRRKTRRSTGSGKEPFWPNLCQAEYAMAIYQNSVQYPREGNCSGVTASRCTQRDECKRN